MKIVITDAQTVTNGDIDLSLFERFGEVVRWPLTDREQAKERLADADAVLMNKTVLDADVLAAAPKLRYIGLFATGYNTVDTAYCHAHGITVCNAGSYSTDAVAQTVFAFMLHHYSHVADYDAFVAGGGWIDSPTFSPFIFPTAELCGKTLGIFGYGTIGQKVAAIARAFGMEVLAVPHAPRPDDGVVHFTDLDTMLAAADVISVHCPLTPETTRLFDVAAFGKCKPGAYFINTSRGGVVVEEALRDAVLSGRLSGAGLDVLTKEPMDKNCVLLGVKGITFTPHVAWAPYETRLRLMDIVADNLQNFLDGHPTHVV